jgi:hypothetical protein
MGPSERAEQETRVAAAKEALRSIPGVKVGSTCAAWRSPAVSLVQETACKVRTTWPGPPRLLAGLQASAAPCRSARVCLAGPASYDSHSCPCCGLCARHMHQVKGSYRGHISLIMTPRQAEASKASISSVCHGLFRSHPQVLGRGRADASRRQQGRDTSSGRQTTGGIDQQQAAIAMKLNEVLATEPYLDGTGIKIGKLFHKPRTRARYTTLYFARACTVHQWRVPQYLTCIQMPTVCPCQVSCPTLGAPCRPQTPH